MTLAADCSLVLRALCDGTVRPEGIELEIIEVKAERAGPRVVPGPTLRHHRMLHEGAYDACEYSSVNYLNGFDRGLPFTAIPFFPTRSFRLRDIWVHADSPFEEPAQLNGRRIGIQLWANSANLWQRAICRHYYGLDLASVEWVCNDPEEIPGYEPPAWVRRRGRPLDRTLEELVVAGELEALALPFELVSAVARPPFRRLFADWATAEQQYYRATGLFPPMHVVVIRNTLLDEHPWVAESLYQAFRQAADGYAATAAATNAPSLIWPGLTWAEQTAILGPQPYPCGLEANRGVLEAAIGYALEQGIVSRRIAPEELFSRDGRPIIAER